MSDPSVPTPESPIQQYPISYEHIDAITDPDELKEIIRRQAVVIEDIGTENAQLSDQLGRTSTDLTLWRTDADSLFGLVERKNNDLLRTYYEAQHDTLTGAGNRRAIEYAIMHKKAGPGDTMILIDLDRFKGVNDKLGHPEGDKILVGFVNMLQRVTREGDLVIRLGGDEFMVLMKSQQPEKTDDSPIVAIKDPTAKPDPTVEEKRDSNVTHRTVGELLMRISTRFQNDLDAHEFSKRLHEIGYGLSFGIAHWEEGMHIEQVMKLADEALYIDKRANQLPNDSLASREHRLGPKFLATIRRLGRKALK